MLRTSAHVKRQLMFCHWHAGNFVEMKTKSCDIYMKPDYSIQCQRETYNHILTVAYVSIAYKIFLPAASFVALWRQRRVMLSPMEAKSSQDPRFDSEIVAGFRFLFENFKSSSWYWELVEMSRKVILTSALILVGQESRSYIGLAWVMAGMYGMLFFWIKPLGNGTENRLMATSLAVTVVDVGVGAVNRIPAEDISTSCYKYVETALFKVLVLGENTLVSSLLIGKTILLLL